MYIYTYLYRIKEMRESLVTLAEAVRSKDELAKALGSEYEGLQKSAQRSAYTRRLQVFFLNLKAECIPRAGCRKCVANVLLMCC
jgi:hypothetical protein